MLKATHHINILGYQIIRDDKLISRAKGAANLIKRHMLYKEIYLKPNKVCLEICSIEFKYNATKELTLASISVHSQEWMKFFDLLLKPFMIAK